MIDDLLTQKFQKSNNSLFAQDTFRVLKTFVKEKKICEPIRSALKQQKQQRGRTVQSVILVQAVLRFHGSITKIQQSSI